MADPVTGIPWQAQELDAIVGDYFEMLAADLSGTPYVKARHRAALMTRIGRSQKSIEFKHQNISAVLEELGAPWIPGYKPARNYQNAIFDAIDRYLAEHRTSWMRLPWNAPPCPLPATCLCRRPHPPPILPFPKHCAG